LTTNSRSDATFEKQVALTIAMLAICLCLIGNRGDNAKTDAIIKTNEASNQRGYFQAKGIKGQMALVLQIAVIICSFAILAGSHRFWWAGMILGAAGIATSVSAFLM
jgi:hypothetical protein